MCTNPCWRIFYFLLSHSVKNSSGSFLSNKWKWVVKRFWGPLKNVLSLGWPTQLSRFMGPQGHWRVLLYGQTFYYASSLDVETYVIFINIKYKNFICRRTNSKEISSVVIFHFRRKSKHVKRSFKSSKFSRFFGVKLTTDVK